VRASGIEQKNMENYFSLPNAESLECYIEGYGPPFPILTVYVPTPEKDYYLVFEQPVYINAPLHWIGADFLIGDVNEREQIARQIAVEPNEVEIYRIQTVLFVAEVDKHTPHPKRIQILALHGKLEEKRQ
jgi:hypothetical protein